MQERPSFTYRQIRLAYFEVFATRLPGDLPYVDALRKIVARVGKTEAEAVLRRVNV